jgi:diaminohydroxyphosphoribosylaminopyrimidine deaminase/5-amino-6-(5-phosphoribosylamino)uracil reductase
MQKDKLYMQRCIDLALLGIGEVGSNPMVGAVIVLDDVIIGEGYHQKFGEAHAEVNAINAVKDKSLLNKATIYVSLEPCSHFGKTPPCADLLVNSNFKKVVIGCKDTFSEVSGRGIEKLKAAKIDVVLGVLEEECRDLNRRFFTFHEQKRPYVILKWAQTKDGFLDRLRDDDTNKINWISSKETKTLVHKWRSEESSILVGKNTILNDNPTLTVRELTGKNPIRIILDSHLSLSLNFNVFNKDAETVVLNLEKEEIIEGLKFKKILNFDIDSILKALYDLNIQSVFVEGGAQTLQSFISSNLWDEVRVIVGNTTFTEGLKAPVLAQIPTSNFSFSSDMIYYYKKI